MIEVRDIHQPFMAWLDKIGIPYHRSRSDKRTTGHKGDPDFLVTWMQRCLYLECKIPGNKLSPDQEQRIGYLRRAGNKVVVAYSLQDCIEACRNILCVGQEAVSVNVAPAEVVPVIEPEPQEGFAVANILGVDWVVARDIEGAWCRIRRASPLDVLNLPKAK